MSPTAVFDTPTHSTAVPNAALNGKLDGADMHNVGLKIVNGQLDLEKASPPLADNYMYDFKYNHALPTTDLLGTTVDVDVDAKQVADGLVSQLETILGNGDAEGFADLFVDYGRSVPRLDELD
jgi:hypothetical protein